MLSQNKFKSTAVVNSIVLISYGLLLTSGVLDVNNIIIEPTAIDRQIINYAGEWLVGVEEWLARTFVSTTLLFHFLMTAVASWPLLIGATNE